MDQATFELLTASPAAFRAVLKIDTDNGPQPLDEKLDDWQREDFAALDAAWQGVALGKTTGNTPTRCYLERPRGHSKTTDIAIMATWALFASRRQLTGVAAAADGDQAKLIRDAVSRLVHSNPWLGEFVSVQTSRVLNPHTESELSIIASDAATSYGLLIDYCICDELTNWRTDDLWVSLFSAAAKRAHCLLTIISNAGIGQGRSWQWNVREAARTDDSWYFHRLDGPQATWLSQAALEEQQRLLPPSAYARLWLNQWTSGDGDALPAADIQAAITLDGPMWYREPGYDFVAAIDLGIKRDHSALVVLACDREHGIVKLAQCRTWRPPRGGSVEIEEVRQAILSARDQLGLKGILYDPWQAEYLAQTLRKDGLFANPLPFTGTNLTRMASTLLESFRTHRIQLYREPDLIADLEALVIVEKSYGFRLEVARTVSARGHGDRATALAIALPTATEVASIPPVRYHDDGLGNNMITYLDRQYAMQDKLDALGLH